MSRTIYLSPQAWRDLEAIEDYTLETWGARQAEIYLQLIDDAFTRIAENPKLGHHHPDVPAPYRAYKVGKHVAVYRYDAEKVELLNILHPAMDVKKRLRLAKKVSKPSAPDRN